MRRWKVVRSVRTSRWSVMMTALMTIGLVAESWSQMASLGVMRSRFMVISFGKPG